MASLHNYPTGSARGHWGEPLTVFRSTGGTPYLFHLHAPTGTVTDLGNVFVAGPAGSGKTTLVLFLLAMAERQNAQVVFFDKDRGGEILARAVGGTYLVLPSGEPTGLAPLKALDKRAARRRVPEGPGPRAGRRAGQADVARRGSPSRTRHPLGAWRCRAEHRSFSRASRLSGSGGRGRSRCAAREAGARAARWAGCSTTTPTRVSLGAPFLGFDITAVLDDAVDARADHGLPVPPHRSAASMVAGSCWPSMNSGRRCSIRASAISSTTS